MKKLLLVGMLAVLMLTGCASRWKYAVDYEFGITSAKGGQAQKVEAMTYQDELLEIKLSPIDDGLTFELRNLSGNSFNIIWNETALLNPEGEVMRVFRSETPLASKDQPQAPSIVPGGSKLTETLFPTRLTYYVSAGRYSDWHTDRLIPMRGRSSESGLADFKADIENLIGKKYGLLMTVETATEKREYRLDFQALGYKIREIDEAF